MSSKSPSHDGSSLSSNSVSQQRAGLPASPFFSRPPHADSLSSSSSSSLPSPSSVPPPAVYAVTSSTHSGWLSKVGGKIQTWHRRYFFIRHFTLCYAKKERGDVLQSISLPGSVLHLYQPVNAYSNRPHLWGLTPAAGDAATTSSRLYVFQAASEEERDEWIQACLHCQARLFSPQSASSSAVLEGWLQGSRRGYFVLTPSHLSYYKAAPDTSTSAAAAACEADKRWEVSAGAAVSVHPSNAFAFSFASEGHKPIELVCTDVVERNHWYRAIADVIERKVEEKEGRRREHNDHVERVLGVQHGRSASSSLTGPPPDHVRPPCTAWQPPPLSSAEGAAQQQEGAALDDEESDDGEQEQQQRRTATHQRGQYSYADSDDEDFSPRAPSRIQKEEPDEEKEQDTPVPPRTPSPAPAVFTRPPIPQRSPPVPMRPRPEATALVVPASPSSCGEDDEDDDDGCYDPLFNALSHSIPTDAADAPITDNPLFEAASGKRSLRAHKPVARPRGSSAGLLSPPSAPARRDSLVIAVSKLAPLGPAGSDAMVPSTAASAVKAGAGMLTSSLSILSSSLQSLLSIAFKGDFAAFRTSILAYIAQHDSNSPSASPSPASSSQLAPSNAIVAPSLSPLSTVARRGKPPAISTALDGVEFQSNPLASSSALSVSATSFASSLPTSPKCPESAPSSMPSSPALPASHRHPRLLHVHLLEAIELASLPSSYPPNVRADLVTRGVVRREAAAGDGDEDGKLKSRKGAKVKSRTQESSRSPLWDEYVTLPCEEWVEEVVVDLVQPETITADVPLGRVVVSVDDIEAQGGRISGWFPVCSKATAQPSQGLLYLALVLDDDYKKESERASDVFVEHRRALLPCPPLTPHVYPTRLFCCTWNVGNAAPSHDLSALLPLHLADVYVVAVQECHYEARHDLKSCKMDWLCCLLRHFGCEYTLVKYWGLWEIRLALFVVNRLSKAVTGVGAQTVATGVGNLLGNKGGVCIHLCLHHTSLAFVNVHLAAHQENTALRNRNVQSIVKSLRFDAAGGGGGAGGSDLFSSVHHLFLAGDLNYRLQYGDQGDAKAPSTEQFTEMNGICGEIMAGNAGLLSDLLVTDQLRCEMQDGRVLPASLGWKEGEPTFPPTFKVRRVRGTRYVSSRSPAWCDRILWKRLKGYRVTQLMLDSVPLVDTSDHKPVVSLLEIDTFLLPAPLDPSKGPCSLAILSLSIDDQPSLRWPDSCLTLESALLPSAIITPPHKKTTPPTWLDLPTRTLQYNNIHRIAHSLVHVKCSAHGSGEVTGRGLISLRPLDQYSQRGGGGAAVGGVGVKGGDGSLSLPFGARVEGGAGGMEMGTQRPGPVDLEFCIGLSLGGLETGKVRGMMRFLFS